MVALSRHGSGLLGTASTLVLFLAAQTAQAQTAPAIDAEQAATDAQMMALIRQQADRIADLEARLERIEKQPVVEAGTPAPGTVPLIVPSLAYTRSQSHTQPPVGSVPPGRPLDLNVTWGAGAPIFAKSDGSFTFKPRGRLLIDLDSTSGSRVASRNVTTTGVNGGAKVGHSAA